jgi:cytochrome c biogenesis protein CcmG, thiol:disulfide interchange protein DsbE
VRPGAVIYKPMKSSIRLSIHPRAVATGLALLCAALLVNAAHAFKLGDTVPTLSLPTATASSTAPTTTFAFDKPGSRIVYIDFWASWCGPCKQSFPWMNEMHDKYASRGLDIVAINVDTRRVDADRFLSQRPVKFTVTFDPKGDTPKQFAIPGMPSSYLIDGNGKVIFIHSGFRDSDRAMLENAIITALTQAKK